MPRQIKAKAGWDDSGNCRQYYQIVTIDDKEPPQRMLICAQDEGAGSNVDLAWYTVCDDGCYYEPEGLIRDEFEMVNEEGMVLRAAS